MRRCGTILFLSGYTRSGPPQSTRGGRAYATGTDYVPETGLALLHRGEAVIPANQNRGRGNITMQFNGPLVRVDRMSSDMDVNALAAKLQRVMERTAEEAIKRAVSQRRT